MNQHATEWLAAYFDDELHEPRLHKVEEHLRICSACRLELEQLQGLSTLLKDCPPMVARTPCDQFAAQVGLRLPRFTSATNGDTWQRAADIGWLTIPMITILLWAFSQITILMISGIQSLHISWTPSLPSITLWLFPYSLWGFKDTNLWEVLRNAAPWLDFGESLAHSIIPYLGSTVVTAIVLWSWVVCWWVLHQRYRFQNIIQIIP